MLEHRLFSDHLSLDVMCSSENSHAILTFPPPALEDISFSQSIISSKDNLLLSSLWELGDTDKDGET